MEEKLVSIIVPVYKVEKYLDKCIESIVNQTYKNLEIILIDDGSPDNCPQMCDEWAKKDERIKVIHKSNGGLSSARNAGVDVANGQYIMFVDSDDYIENDTLADLLGNLIKENADISIGNYRHVYEDKPISINQNNEEIKAYNKKEVFDCLIENNIQTTIACCKIFKIDIVRNVKFPVSKIHEDEFTVHQFLHQAKKVVYTNKIYYNYLMRSQSITNSKNNTTNTNIDDIEALQQRVEFLEINNYESKYTIFAYEMLLNMLVGRYVHSKNKQFKQMLKERFVNIQKEVIEKGYKKHLSFKLKIKLLLFKYCKPILKFLIK